MLNSSKNALRCVTANVETASVVCGLVLVGCGLVFAPELVWAQTNDYPNCAKGDNSYQVSAATSGSKIACAGGDNSVAIGSNATVHLAGSIAIGNDAMANRNSASDAVVIGNSALVASSSGVAVGDRSIAGDSSNSGSSSITAVGGLARAFRDFSTALGYQATAVGTHSTAIGYQAQVGIPTLSQFDVATGVTTVHNRSTAIGYRATTTDHNQFVMGAAQRHRFLHRQVGIGNIAGNAATSYRFAGLAVAEDMLGLAALPGGILTHDQYDARVAAVNTARDAIGYTRVLTVNGHGDVSTVAVDLGAYDTRLSSLEERGVSLQIGSQIDANTTRSQANERAITDNTARSQANAAQGQKNAQGVALSNALSAIPNTLSPGKKLFLGLGVGSFDGKSATAIGVTGKFGASTLLNAGFATGGGESSTRIGIGWEF